MNQPISPFLKIKVGDTVKRSLGGGIMELTVVEVNDLYIICGPFDPGWKFDRQTGAEVDEDLGWGPQFGRTGSFLLPGPAHSQPQKPTPADLLS